MKTPILRYPPPQAEHVNQADKHVSECVKSILGDEIKKILIENLSKEDIVACIIHPISHIFEACKPASNERPVGDSFKITHSLRQRFLFIKHDKYQVPSFDETINEKIATVLKMLLKAVCMENLFTPVVSDFAVDISLKIGALPTINVSSDPEEIPTPTTELPPKVSPKSQKYCTVTECGKPPQPSDPALEVKGLLEKYKDLLSNKVEKQFSCPIRGDLDPTESGHKVANAEEHSIPKDNE